MYDTYGSKLYDERHVEWLNIEYIYLSNSILMNWNILNSSLSGQVIWTKLHIRNSQRKKDTHKPRRKKKNQIRTNKCLCGSYFRVFWVIRPRICQSDLSISYCNTCSRYFLCLMLNLNSIMLRWQAFVFSVLIAKRSYL